MSARGNRSRSKLAPRQFCSALRADGELPFLSDSFTAISLASLRECQFLSRRFTLRCSMLAAALYADSPPLPAVFSARFVYPFPAWLKREYMFTSRERICRVCVTQIFRDSYNSNSHSLLINLSFFFLLALFQLYTYIYFFFIILILVTIFIIYLSSWRYLQVDILR